MLNKLKNALTEQGRDYSDEMVREVIDIFRDDQIDAIVTGLDITEVDRWILLEKLIGTELESLVALDIINKFWEHDIDVLDLKINDN